MAFLFPAQAAEVLDSSQRLALVPVDELLKVLAPKPGLRFLDVGCGTGTYFFPVFEQMQGQGVFLAAELQEEMLRRFLNRLESFVEAPGYSHIEVVRAKPAALPLPDACADIVLLAQVYHEIRDRPAYLRELKRVLAPGGTLCLLDWRTLFEEPDLEDSSPLGPPFEHRVSEAQACAELQEAGFSWVVSHAGFSQNWCVSVKKT